jgi:hypothetical protein
MDMHSFQCAAEADRRSRNFGLGTALAAVILLSSSLPSAAAIFRCVDANGTTTYSDRSCDLKKEPDPPSVGSNPAAKDADAATHSADNARQKEAAHILDLLRIAPVEPETIALQRTVDDAAPDLVRSLDPDNANWTPASARWHTVSEFVKADLRRDVQSALRASTAQVAQTTARQYAARAKDSDMHELTAFLATPDGTRYVAFQNEIRPLLYAALSSLMEQEPMPSEDPSDIVLRQRRKLLSMALEYRIAKEGGGPSTSDVQPGSETVAENAARRAGTALDTLYAEYEGALGPLQTFTDSATAKHFFAAVEPAFRTELALSSTATTDFAEQEFDKYAMRWRAVYGPTVRVSTRAQAAAHKTIQNRCRAEQRLPPI